MGPTSWKRSSCRSVILCACALCMACAIDSVTGKKTLNFFGMSDEVRLGNDVMEKQLSALQKKQQPVDSREHGQDLARIQRIVTRIAKVSHMPKLPYEVHLADVPVVNAWCAPGGKIMVYTGLWDAKEGLVRRGNDADLAAVLAHEIAHATARHVTESLSRNMSLMVAGTVATSVVSAASPQGGNLFGRAVSQGVNLFIPSYSRKNELEADTLGLFYMAKAGYDPRVAVRLWERAAKRKGHRTSLYSTHPASGSRAQALKRRLPEAIAIYEKSRSG
jgi:metalloendopeptidase OMA1, mitochondrial